MRWQVLEPMKTGSGPPSAILPLAERPATSAPASTSERAPEAAPAVSISVPPRSVLQPFSLRTRLCIVAVVGLLGFLFLLRIASILSPFLWGVVVAYAFSTLIRPICRHTR